MKKIKWLLWAVTVALAFTAGSGTASASSGRLDASFGHNGKLILPESEPWVLDSALLPDGRVIVAGYDRLLALLPSGKIDRRFGEAGRVKLAPPEGAHSTEFEQVMVDSAGRIVVVGYCDFSEGSGVHQLIETQELPRQILVKRYTPAGKLDASFGDGGTVLTDFGLPPARPGLTPHLFYPVATLEKDDTILIAGVRRTEQGNKAFVGRLTSDGKNDPSFAPGGGVSLDRFRYVGKPVVDDHGDVWVIAAHGLRKRDLLHLVPDALEPTLVSDQPLTRAALWETLIDDPAGRLLYANQLLGSREQNLENGLRIKRLLPGDIPDPIFGKHGAVAFRFPHLTAVQLATDARGRVLVAMELNTFFRPGHRRMKPTALVLMRLRTSGAVDKSFGRHGLVRVPLGGPEQGGFFAGLDVLGRTALLSAVWCKGTCRSVLTRIVL